MNISIILLIIISFIKLSSTFKCPQDNCKITGCLYQDHDDCTRFWKCDNKGTAFSMKCPDNLEFNENHRYCDWPPSPTCKKEVTTTSTTIVTNATTRQTKPISTTPSTEPTSTISPDQDVCQCDNNSCQLDIPLLDLVMFSAEVASQKFGERNLCKIAQYIRNYATKFYKSNDWVVLVGIDSLLFTPFDYASKVNYQHATFTRHFHKKKISIEVFRPKINEQSPGDLLKGIPQIIPKAIYDIETDMPYKRKVNFMSIINEAFDKNKGDFLATSEDIFKGISKVITGEWAVFVSRHGILTSKEDFCAAYERYQGTYFLGRYQRGDSNIQTHEVLVFAPAKDMAVGVPTRPPSTPTFRPTSDNPLPSVSYPSSAPTTKPTEFECPLYDDCMTTMCLHHNPHNCSQFWQCFTNGKPFLHECPHGFEFNDHFKACDWPPSPTC